MTDPFHPHHGDYHKLPPIDKSISSMGRTMIGVAVIGAVSSIAIVGIIAYVIMSLAH